MTPDDTRQHDIDRGEAWLREIAPRDVADGAAAPDADTIRRRMEIDQHEHWLDEHLSPAAMAADVQDRIKTAIRRALDERDTAETPTSARDNGDAVVYSFVKWSGALVALAAAIALAFLILFKGGGAQHDSDLIVKQHSGTPVAPAPNGESADPGETDLQTTALVDAFLESEDDDLFTITSGIGEQLVVLDVDLDEVERSFEDGYFNDEQDDELNSLEHDIDALLDDSLLSFGMDWS